MGMYGEVEIYIEFKSKEATDKALDNLEANVIEHIKAELKDEPFSFDIAEVDGDGDSTGVIKICSDRIQNAEWRAQQIYNYLMENHKEDMVEFSADSITPTTILFWNEGDE